MTRALALRPAAITDAAAIARVHVESWQAAYAEVMPREFLAAMQVEEETLRWERGLAKDAGRGRTTLVAERDQVVVGYVTVGPDPEEPARGLLFLMYVAPGEWGRGVGRALMAAARELLARDGFDRAVLWVLEENARARRFYERGGWRADGETMTSTYGSAELTAMRYGLLL